MLKNIHQSDFISLYVCIFARGNCSTVGMNTDVRFTVRGLRKTGPECRKTGSADMLQTSLHCPVFYNDERIVFFLLDKISVIGN